MAYFEAVDDHAKNRYYTQAADAVKALRASCWPYCNPMDRVRIELGETWPAGLQIEAIEGRRMFVGLARIFTGSSEALPHQDVLAWDAPGNCFAASELIAQLAANIYVRPAEEGGELELWSQSLDKEDYERFKLPGSYGLDRSKLPSSALVVRPETGDLMLFNANKVHAVRPVRRGTRVTISCFVGVRGLNQALSVWS